MPTSPLHNLKKKIQEANPSILELKFGCEFSLSKCRETVKHIFDSNWYEADGLLLMQGFESEYDATWKLEILGRPIRQDDCSQVVKDKHGLADRWVPGYLDDQTEETITWIESNLLPY